MSKSGRRRNRAGSRHTSRDEIVRRMGSLPGNMDPFSRPWVTPGPCRHMAPRRCHTGRSLEISLHPRMTHRLASPCPCSRSRLNPHIPTNRRRRRIRISRSHLSGNRRQRLTGDARRPPHRSMFQAQARSPGTATNPSERRRQPDRPLPPTPMLKTRIRASTPNCRDRLRPCSSLAVCAWCRETIAQIGTSSEGTGAASKRTRTTERAKGAR